MTAALLPIVGFEQPIPVFCPYCKRPMTSGKKVNNPTRASRDHILPRQWGGLDSWGTEHAPRNLRWCCQECNNLRAAVGHCIGALACLATVTPHKASWLVIAQQWRLLDIATFIKSPLRRKRKRYF